MRLLCALLFLAGPALAQPAPPAPAANEDPADVAARVRYERALRAEYDGRRDEAVEEARACIEAKPVGRFADAARALVARVQASPRLAPSSPTAGPRTALVIESTFAGAYLSALAAIASNGGAQGGTAIVMAGTGAALIASLSASSGKRVPDAMPRMLGNGLTYGTYAALLGLGLNDFRGDASTNVAWVLLGASVGSAAGLLSSLYIPASDAAAISTGMIFGGVLPILVLAAAVPHPSRKPAIWVLLTGSTAGMASGPLLNRALLYSAGRWSLVTLGGLVGGLMGAGTGVIASAWDSDRGRAGFALTAIGSAAGLFLMAKFSDSFDDDRPSTALLHLEGDRLSAGSPLTSLLPARVADRSGLQLTLFDGRF